MDRRKLLSLFGLGSAAAVASPLLPKALEVSAPLKVQRAYIGVETIRDENVLATIDLDKAMRAFADLNNFASDCIFTDEEGVKWNPRNNA